VDCLLRIKNWKKRQDRHKEINEIINKTNKEINDLIANKKDQIEKKKEFVYNYRWWKRVSSLL
jgi:hypothetical protein